MRVYAQAKKDLSVYRKEIDGLRSVAVLPVILFHAGFGIFSGGFVGVDVFFVISGYLITGILLRELQEGRFSILKFYERRARRILPALFAVMLACLPFAWAWMLPTAFEEFARSIIAVCVFLSNVLFWRESGYFAADAEEKPLLHTWSLAVEEQYYVIFPLFLALLWRFRGQWALIGTASAAAVSLVLCEWAARHYPDANFYLLPTRAWELLAGSLCAFWQSSARRRSFGGADPWLASAGLALIVFAIFAFDEHTPFPSIYALIPVLGAALFLLFADADRAAGWILARRAPVSIGLISYSAYLWHQPLFAFARIRSFNEPETTLMGGLAILSLGLAYLSWRYVEAPFRAPGYVAAQKNGLVLTQSRILGLSVVGLVAFAVIGAAMLSMPRPVPPAVNAALAALEEWQDTDECAIDTTPDAARVIRCLQSAQGEKLALLIGDSHVGAISLPMREAMAVAGYKLISFSHPACYPVLGARRLPLPVSQRCQDMMQLAYDTTLSRPDAPVFLFSRWVLNLDGTRFDNGVGGVEKGKDGAVQVTWGGFATGPDRKADVIRHSVQTLAGLAKSDRLVVIKGFPEAGWSVPLRLQKRALFEGGEVGEISIPADRVMARLKGADALLDALEAQGARMLDPASIVCAQGPAGQCVHYDGTDLLYRDDDHPSLVAGRAIATRAVEMLP